MGFDEADAPIVQGFTGPGDVERALLGPGASSCAMELALKLPPLRCPKAEHEHHELDGAGVRWLQRLPAGGVACCVHCDWPVFVPPETCVERNDIEEISATFHFDDLRDNGRDAKPVRPPS